MNCRQSVVRAARFTTLLLGVSAAAWPAGVPTAADLARCAALTAPDARLACYDSLSAPPASAAPAAVAAPAPSPAITPSLPAAPPPAAAPAAPVALAPTAAPAPATAPPTKAPAVAAAVDNPQNFGFTPAQVHAHTQAPPEGLQSIQAHVANVFTDRMRNAFVLLDNGQMWEYQGDDGRLRPGDSVTIKRASLGSFIMLTQSKRSYHVTRSR